MAKHIVKSAISVSCNRGHGEEDVVKFIFAMARYMLNKRKNTKRYTDTTYVPKTKEYRDLICQIWKYTLTNPEDLICVPIYNSTAVLDGEFANGVNRISIPVAEVLSHGETPVFKPEFIDAIEDSAYLETKTWLNKVPIENSSRYIKDKSVLCQQTYIGLLEKYNILKDLELYVEEMKNIQKAI